MKYTFRRTRSYKESFEKLTGEQQAAARAAFKKFKINPFDPSLGTHSIKVLSSRSGRTIYSVVIESDLRSLFFLDGDVVVSFEIGSHKIYR